MVLTTKWWFANIMEIWTLFKQAARKFYGEIFSLRKASELEVWRQYQIEVTERFVALENFFDEEYINWYWYNIKENVKNSANKNLDLHELKQHKQWFDEECFVF